MDWDDLSPEAQRQVEAEAAEFERQLARVGVDLRMASSHMHKPDRRSDATSPAMKIRQPI